MSRRVVKSKRANWRMPLSRPIQVKAGPKLETLADVRDFILAEPGHVQERPVWQLAACGGNLARRGCALAEGGHHPAPTRADRAG